MEEILRTIFQPLNGLLLAAILVVLWLISLRRRNRRVLAEPPEYHFASKGEHKVSFDDYKDEILNEGLPTILECLGDDEDHGAKIFTIEKTEHGFRIVEACDAYYGRTLTREQLKRLAAELNQLADT